MSSRSLSAAPQHRHLASSTVRRSVVTLVVSTGLVATACATRASGSAGPARLTPSVENAPVAAAAADAAEFVFPIGAPRRFIPTPEDSARGYPDQGFIWSVGWDVNGVPGFGIEARSGTPRGMAPGRDTLETVIAAARLSRAEPADAGDLPAVALHPEWALTAAVLDRHVVLTLRGRDALRRLWPHGPPDTVTFFWRGPGAQLAGKKVALVRLP